MDINKEKKIDDSKRDVRAMKTKSKSKGKSYKQELKGRLNKEDDGE
jgi:hypothetical protein